LLDKKSVTRLDQRGNFRSSVTHAGAQQKHFEGSRDNERKKFMPVSEEVLRTIAETLVEKYGISTVAQLDKAVAEIKRMNLGYRDRNPNDFSLSRAIRGSVAMQWRVLVESSKDEDIGYTRALTTGSTPGSYIVPTISANEIIAYLSNASVVRSAGVRIWPLGGIDKMTIPAALAAPTVEYKDQNSVQAATDPNIGQISFSMKTARCLTAVPNELLAVSTPAVDQILGELIAVAFGEAEDAAILSTSAVSGGPTSTLYSVSGTTTYNVGNSANGGNLSYPDLTAVLYKSAGAKARGPFVFICSPRTWWQRIVGLVDSQSRPIVTPDVQNAIQPRLFGYNVYVSNAVPENQTVGSGSGQSFLAFLNPKYLHIADGQSFEIATSTEFLFSSNATAVRGSRRHDTAFSPAAGIVLLKGIN
jgi:HK97 family phage major capsid protein